MEKKTDRPRRALFWKRHSLSIAATAVLLFWLVLYLISDSESHAGTFFGDSIGDWIGVVMTVLVTKWLFEKGSGESRQPARTRRNPVGEFLHEHSLTVFLLISGIGWLILFSASDPGSRWGTILSNVSSEWVQQIGLVVLTKKLIETGSKESK